jgi:hypothetical protein
VELGLNFSGCPDSNFSVKKKTKPAESDSFSRFLLISLKSREQAEKAPSLKYSGACDVTRLLEQRAFERFVVKHAAQLWNSPW